MRLLPLFTRQPVLGFGFSAVIVLIMYLPQVSFAQSDSVNSNSSAASGRHYGNIVTDDYPVNKTGDTDYDFAMMMRMHHEQGRKMAQNEIDNGKDATLRKLAKKIVATQKKEIAQFDRWLAEHPPKSK